MAPALCLVLAGLAAALVYAWLAAGWLRGWKEIIARHAFAGDPGYRPEVSLIIAIRDEEQNLPRLMAALETQEYPSGRLEVIFVNDHSHDQGAGIVRSLQDNRVIPTKLIDLEGEKGKKAALKAGVAAARGDYVLFTDADCLMGPCWVSAMIDATLGGRYVMILGPVAVEGGTPLLGGFQQQEMAALMAVTAGTAGTGKAFLGNGANLLVKRSILMELGESLPGKSLASGDDVFLVQQVRKNLGGDAITFQPAAEALVRTQAGRTLRALCWQRVRWASKGYSYRDQVALSISAYMLLLHLLLLGLQVTAILQPSLVLMVLAILAFKAGVDYKLAVRVVSHTGYRLSAFPFLAGQVCYPLYVLSIALLGLLPSYPWKGRLLK